MRDDSRYFINTIIRSKLACREFSNLDHGKCTDYDKICYEEKELDIPLAKQKIFNSYKILF